MPAYVVADIVVNDDKAYETYKSGVADTVTKFGGRFLVRGGAAKSFEGGWQPQRLVIIEFPDMARLEAWYHSADYAPLLAIRLKASDGRLIGVQGT